MWEPRTMFNNVGGNPELRRTITSTSRTRFYAANGGGRDTYIYGNNGGLFPSSEACKIEEQGTFVHQKHRPREFTPVIHSKSVLYHNNGGGRDTYISSSSGGLTSMNAPA